MNAQKFISLWKSEKENLLCFFLIPVLKIPQVQKQFPIILFNEVFGNIGWTAKILGNETDLADAAPRALLFLVCLFIVAITKFKVNYRRSIQKENRPDGANITTKTDNVEVIVPVQLDLSGMGSNGVGARHETK